MDVVETHNYYDDRFGGRNPNLSQTTFVTRYSRLPVVLTMLLSRMIVMRIGLELLIPGMVT